MEIVQEKKHNDKFNRRMKAVIKSVKYVKEYETKFGVMHSFKVTYDDKQAFYTCKTKEQSKFVEGKEAEFIEEVKTTKDGKEYLTIKLPPFQKQSNFGKALTKEQSRYSGFAASYVKDLIVAGILKPETDEKIEAANDVIFLTWKKRSFEIFEHLVSLDKTLEV